LFGAYLLSSQLRNDWFNIFRHHIASENQNNIDPDHVTKTVPFQPIISPLTSIQSLQHYTTDDEFIQDQFRINSNDNKNQKKITKTFKNFEFMHVLSEWETLFKGGMSVSQNHTPIEQFNEIINNRLSQIVGTSSKTQTVLGFFSAGPVKSFKYAMRKLKKGKPQTKSTYKPPTTTQKSSFHTKSRPSSKHLSKISKNKNVNKS
jgi:hypothetical protein